MDPAGGIHQRSGNAYMESHDEERVMFELESGGFTLDEARRRAELALALTLTAPTGHDLRGPGIRRGHPEGGRLSTPSTGTVPRAG